MLNNYKSIIFFLLFNNFILAKTEISIIKSTESKLEINLTIEVLTYADLYPTTILVGLPNNTLPKIRLISSIEKLFKHGKEQSDDRIFSWTNVQLLKNLNTAVLKINPCNKIDSYFNKIHFEIIFDDNNKNNRTANKNESKLLSNRIINWNIAKNWLAPINKINPRKLSNSEEGQWFSFDISEDGMKKISAQKLIEIIDDFEQHDPRSLMLLMPFNLGRAKTQETNIPIQDNLIEIPIIFKGESDGYYNQEDDIIFYGRGPKGYDVSNEGALWNQNLYFKSNKCWIFVPRDNSIRGKRISSAEQPSQIDISLDYGISYYHYELDLINLDKSGLNWLGSKVDYGGFSLISTNTPNAVATFDSQIEIRFRGNATNGSPNINHNLDISLNSLNNNIGNSVSWFGNNYKTFSTFLPGENLDQKENSFFISNNSTDNFSSPYIDYFNIKYGRKLLYENESFEFYSPVLSLNARFNFMEQLTENIFILDVTDPTEPKNISIINNQRIDVALDNNQMSRYVIYDINSINNIDNIKNHPVMTFNKLRNQSILANYIIIGPEEYLVSAQPILDIRSPSIYATLDDIYNEFSGGNQDPMAIRSFLQWSQEKWIQPTPIHLLLLGDAGYDYRNITGESSIVTPTIQVQSFISYPSDDRLATIYGAIPELSIGRFPAKNKNEVENFVQKILFINNENNFGIWKQKITLVADDAARPEPNHGGIATGKSHTLNSETISQIIPSRIDIQKIYMLEFPEESDASAYGVIKPQATDALINALNNGTAIINYIGHGSAYQLAQERLLYLNRGDLERIKTDLKMPLWIVGTCSFGHFDDPKAESFAEQLIRYPMDGASAVISTCRPITVTGNERYTQDIFESIFNNVEPTNNELGVILQSIKNGSSESEYFHLFGDPAMEIPLSTNIITQLDVNPDTLSTLNKGSVSIDYNDFQNIGKGVLILKDANRNVTRSYNIASTTEQISYSLPGPTLFRGIFDFENFPTNTEFRVPQDISYSDANGKILVYLNDDKNDAIGKIDNITLIGGNSSSDIYGPLIEFSTNSGRILRNSDHVNSSDVIIIKLSDPLGINLTKELGHSIIVSDLNNNESYDMTDQFYYDLNSITQGEIIFNRINNNDIFLKVSAWDNANNPSETQIKLNLSIDNNLKLYSVFNFPNPFSKTTKFTFELSSAAKVSIYIYTLGGKKIKKIEKNVLPSGYHSIDWNGKNQFGSKIANGVYIYKIIAENNEHKISLISRLAKIN